MKKYITIAIIFGLILSGIFLLISLSSKNKDLALNNANFAGASKKVKNGNKIVISTPSGDVEINNIFTKSERGKNGELLPITLEQKQNYDIKYYYDGDYFGIILLQKPLLQARLDAENSFLNMLGVSKEDACKLSHQTNIPAGVDAKLGGDLNYGFSFCPGDFSFK